VGEGNNTAVALALGASRCPGFSATFVTPAGYGLPSGALRAAQAFAACSGAEIAEIHDFRAAPARVDIVYTTRWQTTGTVKPDESWRECFAPYRVSAELMRQVSKPSGTLFMHDLPAVRGEDCDGSVIDGPQSVVFEQSRQKMFSAMAILEWCTA
jgi:ornithine carbamoyltransferase